MKPSSNGSCCYECDGCERDAPYADDFVKFGWRHSDEYDLDLCPSCWDRLSDGEILELWLAKVIANKQRNTPKKSHKI
jgi:hypothetical protein